MNKFHVGVTFVALTTVLWGSNASWTTIRAQALTGAESLSCVRPVPGVTWLRAEGDRQSLDLWCQSVGPPLFVAAAVDEVEISRLLILSWNVHVGGGRVEELIAELLKRSSEEHAGLIVLLQETFRAGADVPESYPATLDAPSAIRPRRPTLDIVGLARRLGLSVAYVPSMRNGSATRIEAREDRGNAVLSSEPLSDVRAIELPFGKQRRVAMAVTVTPRGAAYGPMRVVSTHFDTNSDRVPQAEALAEWIASIRDLPLIAGGDLNAHLGSRDGAVRAVSRSAPLESCGTGRTSRWPLRLDLLFFFFVGRADYIFSTLGPEVTRTCQTLRHAYGSDHLPLLLEVQLR